MLMPSIFGENLFDDFFDDYFPFDTDKELHKAEKKRSFYVGEEVDPGEIKAEFKHGILKLFVPKKEAKPAVEENKYIAIEG